MLFFTPRRGRRPLYLSDPLSTRTRFITVRLRFFCTGTSLKGTTPTTFNNSYRYRPKGTIKDRSFVEEYPVRYTNLDPNVAIFLSVLETKGPKTQEPSPSYYYHYKYYKYYTYIVIYTWFVTRVTKYT